MAKSSVKFRDSVSAFEVLQKQVAAGQFSPVYLLMGDEGYFIDQLADTLAENTLSDAEKAFNLTVVYGREATVGAIINTARQMPMMGGRQVVVVREAQQLKKIEELSVYTATPSPSTILVLCHKDKNLDKRTQLYKHVAAKGVVFESVQPRDYEIRDWLGGFVASHGLKAEPKALEMLTEHLGIDLAKISAELSKLVLALPENATRLTAEDVERNTGFSKDFNNYELCKAVTNRQLHRAFVIAENFSQNPKEHPLLVSVLSLFGQFREIFLLNYYSWLAKNKGVTMPSDIELAAELKLPHPFFVKELREAAVQWPNKLTFRVLGLLREYDAKSKGIGAGSASDGELLRELLLKMFALR